MNKLKVVKALDSLNRVKKDVAEVLEPEEANNLNLYVDVAIELLQCLTHIKMDKENTTPQKLYNKKYRDLSVEELREYSQIKRIIKRRTDEKSN